MPNKSAQGQQSVGTKDDTAVQSSKAVKKQESRKSKQKAKTR